MMGMEMMIANLLGMKPEEMRAQVKQAVTLMETGANSMTQIQSDLAKIKAHLGIDQEEFSNGGTAIAHRGSANGNRIEL
jgi:hypothetical protein